MRTVHDELRERVLPADHAELTELDKLLRLDASLFKLKNYQLKIRSELQGLLVLRTFWAAQDQLYPYAKPFYFAGENPDDEQCKPYLMLPHTLELLRSHSSLLAANWGQYCDNQRIWLQNVDRTGFIKILEHLTKLDVPEVPDEEIAQMYHAVDYLGITHLEKQYYAKLCRSLAEGSWDMLLTMLCDIATGEIDEGGRFGQAVFLAFMESECRFALHKEYYVQPSAADYIKDAFCPKHGITWEHFKEEASKRFRLLSNYLASLENSEKDLVISEAETLPQLIISTLTSIVINPQVLPNLPALANRLKTNPDYKLLSDHLAWIIDPAAAPFEFLRLHPAFWVDKQEKALTSASTAGEYDVILKEVALMQPEQGEVFTEKMRRLCFRMTFVCLLKLGKEEELRACAEHVHYADFITQDSQNSYLVILAEKGEFQRINEEAISLPQWMAELQALYELRLFGYEKWETQPFKCIAAFLQGHQQAGASTVEFKDLNFTFSIKNPIASLQEHCKRHPKQALPRILLAQLCWKGNLIDDAMRYSSEVLALQPNTAMNYRRYDVCLEQRNLECAKKEAEQLLRADLIFSFTTLTNFIWQKEGMQAALDFFSAFPSSRTAKFSQIYLHNKNNKIEEAKRVLNEFTDETKAETYFAQHLLAEGLNLKMDAIKQARKLEPETFLYRVAELILYSHATLSKYSKRDLESLRLKEKAAANDCQYRATPSEYTFRYFEFAFNLFEGRQELPKDLLWTEDFRQLHFYNCLHAKLELVSELLIKVRRLYPKNQQQDITIYQAHRLGQDDTVIQQANADNELQAIVLIDSLRRKRDFQRAKEVLCKQRRKPVHALLEAAIQWDEAPYIYHANIENTIVQVLEHGYPYYPFYELAFLVLAKNEANNPDSSKLAYYLDKLESFYFAQSAETLQFLQTHGRKKQLQFTDLKRAAQATPEMNAEFHNQLARQGKYGLMDKAFLASSPDHRKLYGEYLFHKNEFEKALPVLLQTEANDIWIAECYAHLGQWEKASELKTRFKESGSSIYPEACKLFAEGKFQELVECADVPLTRSLIESKGLYLLFLAAKSYFELEQHEKAAETIKTIQKYAASYADRYGHAFFKEIAEWNKHNLGGPSKKIRGNEA